MPLHGYSDASWGELKHRKSTTGYCFKSYMNLLSCKTAKQKTVSLSSTDAEYVALSTASQEDIWLKRLLDEFGITNGEGSFVINIDNQGAKYIAEQLETRRPKHIELKYHFIRQQIQDGRIKLKYIESGDQVVNFFTKPLNKIKFVFFKNLLNIEM